MSASPSVSSSSRSDLPASSTRFAFAAILIIASLTMCGLGVAHLLRMLGNNWMHQRPERIAVIAAALLPAFLASALFCIAACLLFSRTQHSSVIGFRRYSTATILLALYGPFYWAIDSSWLHLLPVLPGFTAGVFTKPLDNNPVFVVASCTCTGLIVVSLFTIRNRLRHGQITAPIMALVTSALVSYAAYAFMRA